jgi:hypothetical protein
MPDTQKFGRLHTPKLFVLAWGLVAALAVAVCYFSLGHYDHNDHMYAVAPVLAQRLRPYADFAFVQTPLSLLIFAQIFKLAGAVRFYAALRIFSLTLNLAIVGIGILLVRRHAVQRNFAALLFAGLYLWFHQAEIIGAEIGNYTLALVFMALALMTFDRWRDAWWSALAVGVLAGLSLSAKLSSIFVCAAFALLYLQSAGNWRSRLERLALYGVGGILGCLPIIYYLAADPGWFLFDNIHFHYLSNIYRGLAPSAAQDTIKTGLAAFSIGSGAFALALLALVALVLFDAWKAALTLWPGARKFLSVTQFEKDTLVIAAATIIGAVTPGVVFQQYMAAPAFALFLFAALFLDRLLLSAAPDARSRWQTVCIICVMLLGAWRIDDLVTQTAKRQADGVYGITAVADMRARLATAIAAIDQRSPDCHGDLVTAFGVPAIGAGAQLAPITSTGSFAMRLDYIFAIDAPGYRRISDPAQSLTPRSLILSGFYNDASYEPRNDFETVMNAYAAKHGFGRIALGTFMYKPVFLYAPPACGAPQT